MNPLREDSHSGQTLSLGSYQTAVDARLDRWKRDDVPRRIWARDHTVWSPTMVPELADRLGWLSLPDTMEARAAELTAFAREVGHDGIRHVILLGMGGSSLAPEVFQATFGNTAGHPELIVLDSTHPGAVGAVDERIDLARSIFVVSSKSGGTSETTSFFRHFWNRYEPAAAGRHFIAITDPGTSLEKLAVERQFRRAFLAPQDVGGRYSALTVFGLLPAALVGVDLHALIRHARLMSQASGPNVDERLNPALALGAALGELALAGRDKVTFFFQPPLTSLPGWLEQLIAESTGKNGKGIVPIADEPVRPAAEYGPDRVFVSMNVSGSNDPSVASTISALAAEGHPVVRVTLGGPIELGGEFFRWEFATAAAGAVLGIQPFDQPDVQLAKDLSRRAMEARGAHHQPTTPMVTAPASWPVAIERWLSTAQPGDYLGLHAYLAPGAETTALLQQVRDRLGRRTRLATSLGFGPRFLHSTGQLHKGGPNSGLFLQFTDEISVDLPVPETDFTFGQLISAQAAGDAMALEQRGRRLLRIGLGKDPAAALRRLVEMV